METFRITAATTAGTDITDITPEVEKIAARGTDGTLVLFVPGSTAALTTIEYENGAVHDLRAAIERIAPQNIPYEHDSRWGDGNGFSHVRSALLKTGITVPIVDGTVQLGTWQQIVLLDFDNRPRKRRIEVQILG